MKTTLAIDIGGTNFSVAVFQGLRMVASASHPTDRAAGPHWMLDTMEDMVGRIAPAEKFDGCGIGFGGPVDFPSQQVILSTQVPGWNGFALVTEVEKRFGAPAIMDRDSLVGALGEGTFGAGVGFLPLFYVTLSTGVGGGLLTGDGLFRGADSYACELGHHTVVQDGPKCLCGSHGCLERMCSGLWLERDLGETAEVLFRDPDFVRRYVVPLAQGLKNTIMFLNPARIIIGGGISKAGDALFRPLREELTRQMPTWSRARVEVVPAELGPHTILWGAFALVDLALYNGFFKSFTNATAVPSLRD